MTLEDDVRKCCDEIESLHQRAEELKQHCTNETKGDLSSLEAKLNQYARDARAATEKLSRGMLEGLQGLVEGWRSAHNRLVAHLLLIEAKGFLTSARNLAGQGDFVAARNELIAAMRDQTQASSLLPKPDDHLTELERQIEHAVAEIQNAAGEATNTIEEVVALNERLLEDLKRAS